jgi:uncharacterized protein YnzC (UPF0291/DUF896 family)
MSCKEMMAKSKSGDARGKERMRAMRQLLAESKALTARVNFLVRRAKAGTASEEEVAALRWLSEEEVAALRWLSEEEMPAMRARLLQMFSVMKDSLG